MRFRMACPWCCGDLYPIAILGSRRMVCVHCRRMAPVLPRPDPVISGYEEEHFRRLLRSGPLNLKLTQEAHRQHSRHGGSAASGPAA